MLTVIFAHLPGSSVPLSTERNVLLRDNPNEVYMSALNDLYEEANKAYQNGEYEKATRFYEAVLANHPESEEAKLARVNIDSIKDDYS